MTSTSASMNSCSSSTSSYSWLLRVPFNVDFFTVFHASGVARPWLVTRYAHSVVWSSFSKSVQSSATTISLRTPTTNLTHGLRTTLMSKPALLNSRSTCLTPLLGLMLATFAYAWPMAWMASAAACRTPTTPLERDNTRAACMSSLKRFWMKVLTYAGSTLTSTFLVELMHQEQSSQEQIPIARNKPGDPSARAVEGALPRPLLFRPDRLPRLRRPRHLCRQRRCPSQRSPGGNS